MPKGSGHERPSPVSYRERTYRRRICCDGLRSFQVVCQESDLMIRADSRLLEQDQQRIVRVIDYLLETAFPGVSGFKHDRQPPHRVEGGACVPLTPEQRSEWRLEARSRVAGNGPAEPLPGRVQDHEEGRDEERLATAREFLVHFLPAYVAENTLNPV